MTPLANFTVNIIRQPAYRQKLWLSCILLVTLSCKTKKADNEDYSSDFKIIFNQVTQLFELYKTDQGIRYLDSAMNKIQPTVNDRFRAYGFHYVYWKKIKSNNARALLYADSMMLMARKSVNQRQYAANYSEASYAKGDAYFDMQQYNDAYQNYFQGYLIGKNNLNNVALSDFTYRMGMIMYKQAHYKLAAHYFIESLQKNAPTTDSFADFYRKQELIDNIGLSYKHSGNIDSAFYYFDKNLHYIEEQTPRFKSRHNMLDMAKGVVYGNKAEVLMLQGNRVEAIDLLKKSIAINLRKGNDNRDAELSEIKLSQLYYEAHQDQQLFDLLKVIRIQLDSVRNIDAEISWNGLMSKYYERKKEPATALTYFERYNSLKDTAVARSQALRESDVNQQVANFEKQYQINNLQNNNKFQLIYIYIVTGAGLAGLIFIFLIIKYWRRSRRDVMIFRKLNNQISKQKIALENTLNELSSSGQEKDRILRNVAHDLRNPIGGIASLTTVMVDEDDYSDDQKELLKLIKETAYDTIELINEILEATNNSEKEVIKQAVDINALLSNSVELMRFKAAEKNQKIYIEFLDEPEELMINREKIKRVISNLISNAIKFSPTGSSIRVKLTNGENVVKISVSDNGIGIPAKIKDKVFNMFTEAKRPGTMGEKIVWVGIVYLPANHRKAAWRKNMV